MILTITWNHWQTQDIVKADLRYVCVLYMLGGSISKKGRMVRGMAESKDDELSFK